MKTILVVDDDEAIRTLLQEELEDEGYKVLIATNARDALKMVAAEPLDLVILDIRMPGMDGLEALPRILGIKEGLPVIMNTAYTGWDIRVGPICVAELPLFLGEAYWQPPEGS